MLSILFIPQSYSDDIFVVDRVVDDYWLIDENLPACFTHDNLRDAIELLSNEMQSCDTESEATYPTIIRFVPSSPIEPFPDGTEGFAGLTGIVDVQCITVPIKDEQKLCQILVHDSIEHYPAKLVIVTLQSNPQETMGFLIHELAHTCGGVDGLRCPAHPDYNPNQSHENDVCDCYWWYGVVGFFDAVPQGIIHNALNDTCDSSENPQICHAYADIFERVDWDDCQ